MRSRRDDDDKRTFEEDMQLIKTTARIDYDEDSEAFTPLKKKKKAYYML